MEGLRRVAPVVGRVLLSIIFILSGLGKIEAFSGTASMMGAHGIPIPEVTLVAVILIELLGGLALLTGIHARLAAMILFIYLIPVSLVMHNFWTAPAGAAQMQQVQFLKNLAILGGLLLCATCAPESSFFRHRPTR